MIKRKAVECLGHRAVGGELLVFRRRGFALEEKEFRAQKSDPFGAGLDCAGRFVGFANVRDDLDAMAVGHDRGLVARLEFHVTPALQIDPEFFRRFQIGFGRREVEPTGRAVENANLRRPVVRAPRRPRRRSPAYRANAR